VTRGAGRGRLARPRPTASAGYTLIELLFAVALVTVVSGIAVASVARTVERARGQAAARYLAARMTLARTQAVTWGSAVALRFEQTRDGLVFSAYRDGNRNGVLTADIQQGLDRQIEPPMPLAEQFPGVDIGLARGIALSDPVHIGRTSLLSFSPLGTSTSGSIYVLGADGTQWAVRVLGATGRVRILRHSATTDEWTMAY
jgi:prepilin-type N-terminal cleavage/methylation domain-containing protein